MSSNNCKYVNMEFVIFSKIKITKQMNIIADKSQQYQRGTQTGQVVTKTTVRDRIKNDEFHK